MRAGAVLGGIALLIGIALLSLNILSTSSIILQILGVLNILMPFLSGRKIARYLHDFSLVKERGFKASPMAMVYIWLFFWLVFLVLYSLATLALSYTFKFILMETTGGTLTGIIASILILAGSFYLFKSLSRGKGFLTSWGRRIERMDSAHKRIVDEARDKVGRFMP